MTRTNSPISLLVNIFFRQARDHLWEKDSAGPSAFRLLQRLLSTHVDHGDQSRGASAVLFLKVVLAHLS